MEGRNIESTKNKYKKAHKAECYVGLYYLRCICAVKSNKYKEA